MAMRKYTVTMEMWRETWGGSEQCDDDAHVETVVAGTKASAIKKAVQQAVAPPKGRAWSHRIWARNATITSVADIRKRKVVSRA